MLGILWLKEEHSYVLELLHWDPSWNTAGFKAAYLMLGVGILLAYCSPCFHNNLTQVITDSVHWAGHALDLVFGSGQEECDLRLEDLTTVLLSWTKK